MSHQRNVSAYIAWRNGPASARMRACDTFVPDAMSDRCVEDVLSGLAPRDLDDLPFTFIGDDDDG